MAEYLSEPQLNEGSGFFWETLQVSRDGFIVDGANAAA